MRSSPFTDQRRTPFASRPSGIVQVSPFVHSVFDGSDVGPTHASTESVDTAAPAPLKYLPSVALLPASERKNGWMWMTPSPWVWRPVRTPGLSATLSNSGRSESLSPQMSTSMAACQWSPSSPVAAFAGRGGTPAASLLSRTVKKMRRPPMRTMTPMARFQPMEALRRLGLR